jgi:hypothetical protein
LKKILTKLGTLEWIISRINTLGITVLLEEYIKQQKIFDNNSFDLISFE